MQKVSENRDVLVIAPHPDDETLGCGGTLFSHRLLGDRVHWIIFTSISENAGYSRDQVARRKNEIEQVASFYGFTTVIEYDYHTCSLDTISKTEMVNRLSNDISLLKPEIIYIPHFGDVHSDHKIVNEVSLASSKWFRQPSIKTVRAYETLSETGMLGGETLSPNQYSDISQHIDRKIEAMRMYATEMGDFPFPRSEEAIRALASYRGANSGCDSAEAFRVLFEKL